jgi:D-aminoacyl-tRNA deacylase
MCTEDQASINIRNRLLEIGDFEVVGDFEGLPVRYGHGMFLFEKEGLHLYLDGIDREIANCIEEEFVDVGDANRLGRTPLDLLVFLSKHSSEKKVASLTVHPPGNYLNADHGGRNGFLPPSAPVEMTSALKQLYKEKKALGIKDQTTFEVTHHGPAITSPSFFIEIGSDPSRWGLENLGEAIARTLLSGSLTEKGVGLPISIGIGGGHYAPRFTDRAMRNKFYFGHMIPDYILTGERAIEELIEMAKGATEGAEYAFIHRSNRNEKLLQDVESAIEESGLRLAD